ncbi:flavin reductase family protein [Methanobacterium aggregans]|uniref:flavin reductase family protein n=1 Tax=Methanobacterium aggregans TaxID=1615586 RepID=UPI001AE62325|nr:flavin reductase family protein [Methanobacterium aggregans]MBP2045081.1 flavin reductase (DIM6/NTAB) family NADH-FMN oxidoreductase RutF [Methanobacterium aggregans]
MEFNDLEVEHAYRVLAPRPTIIVTTANSRGEANAAPFSFTMPVSVKPPLVAFASVPSHHTYKNIEETQEFVVNIPNEEILEKLWITGEKFPYGVNEIEESGLSQMESLRVSVPKIAECIAHMECKVHWIKDSGDHKLVVGEVVYADATSDALKEGLLDVEKMKPVLHLGGVNFVVGDHLRKVE